MIMDSQSSKQETRFVRATQVWLAVNHKLVSFLANEFDVRSVLHGQMSLNVVDQMYVERLQKSKDLLKACFENVKNTHTYMYMRLIALNIIRRGIP